MIELMGRKITNTRKTMSQTLANVTIYSEDKVLREFSVAVDNFGNLTTNKSYYTFIVNKSAKHNSLADLLEDYKSEIERYIKNYNARAISNDKNALKYTSFDIEITMDLDGFTLETYPHEAFFTQITDPSKAALFAGTTINFKTYSCQKRAMDIEDFLTYAADRIEAKLTARAMLKSGMK